MLVFSTKLCELLLLFLLFGSNLPPFPVWKSTLHTRIQCVRGYGVLGHRQRNTCRKSLYRSIFLDNDILRCLLWVLSFYGFIGMQKMIWRNSFAFLQMMQFKGTFVKKIQACCNFCFMANFFGVFENCINMKLEEKLHQHFRWLEASINKLFAEKSVWFNFRGAKQLSWNYNYGALSAAMFGDSQVSSAAIFGKDIRGKSIPGIE
jgi:hypothetical protein